MGRVLTRQSSQQRLVRTQRLVLAMRMLGDRCARCGHRDRNALQFDHVNPEEKELTIAAVLSHRWARVKRELAKCQLLCANCHLVKSRMEASHSAALELIDLNSVVLVSSTIEGLVEGGAGSLEVVANGLKFDVPNE